MHSKAVYKYCKHLGCCEACCLRYIGIKNRNAYENVANFVIKYKDEDETAKPMSTVEQNQSANTSTTDTKENIVYVRENDIKIINGKSLDVSDEEISNGVDSNAPPCKKKRLDVCVSCLGVLQEDNWIEGYVLVKDVLCKKKYENNTFACALSAPIATLLRERAITLRLAEKFPGYDDKALTALKEAWKWSFGVKLATKIEKTLDSGAVSPLLVTLNYDYADDLQELEILKQVSPQLFEERSKQKRFVTEFTRRSVEQALEAATLKALQTAAAGGGLPAASARAVCVGAVCTHAPMYLAGRYIKLSRNLPQTPWILDGKRVLPSSVQEIIYKPLADLYNLDGEAEEADRRLKLIAAGREDVDVRCLGDGRPFAIEIADPTRQLTSEELTKACEDISKSGEVIVKQIVPITREDLVQLKKGEETKSKTYEALCIKLSHSEYDVSPNSPIKVTPDDIARINSFRNTPHISKQNTDHALNTTKNDQNSSKTFDKTKIDKGIGDNPKSSENIKSKCIDHDKSTPDDGRNDRKAENLDNSQDDEDTVMQASANVPDCNDASEIDKFNGVQKAENATSGDNLQGAEDILDTTDEVTDSEITDTRGDVKITIQQKTPIRVLHRRPLLTRTRHILDLEAIAIPEQPQLFRILVRTSAGTYVKEWAHGELGRSRPSLGDAMAARVDLLALDVTAVHLEWPPRHALK